MNDTLAANRLVDLLACYVGVLVDLVVLSVIFIVMAVDVTDTRHIARIVGSATSVASPRSPMASIPSKDVIFSRMGFDCGGSDRRPILGSVGLSVHSNRAVKVVNNAKDTGSDLIGLVDHLCSMASNSISMKNVSIHGCRLRSLEGRISIILRGGMLFSKAVLRGLQ